MKPTKAAYKLMHEGAIALAEVESNGMRIDVDYLDDADKKVERRIAKLEQHLKRSKIWEEWQRAYPDKANLDSRTQLAHVLFERMGFDCEYQTATGRNSASRESLEAVDVPFTRDYLKLQKYRKLRSTYLKGIRREVVNGYLHPHFNLHMVVSYRSSSSSPNFQNIPTRDPEIAKLIRRAFVPRPDHVLVEIDYSAIEVRVAACYHEDPTMVKYIKDNYDLHRDMAAELFMLDEVPKKARFVAKNSFVFAEFYGDYYPKITAALWHAIRREKLATADGTPMFEHLRAKGIEERGNCDPSSSRPKSRTFEQHVQKIENGFWYQRFPQYWSWKNDWWDKYQQKGSFRNLTGFVFDGVYRRNEVLNYPVQSSAFHCLLWSLIRLNKLLRKSRSMIVGQIHDSLVLDVHREELDDVVSLAKDVMCEQLKKHWSWIVVPLEVEVEVAEENWFEKEVFTR